MDLELIFEHDPSEPPGLGGELDLAGLVAREPCRCGRLIEQPEGDSDPVDA